MTDVAPQVDWRGKKCRCTDGLSSCDLTGTVRVWLRPAAESHPDMGSGRTVISR